MKYNLISALFFLQAFTSISFSAGAQTISTIAGNGTAGYSGDNILATIAELKSPWGVALDRAGNIYISDNLNNRVRKVDFSGTITTIAGTGTAGYNGDGIAATLAQLNVPHGIAVDDSGNVFVADLYNVRIRKINTSGIISTIAGVGTSGFTGDDSAATAAKINSPYGMVTDHSGNLYFADCNNNCIRKVNAAGIITTIAGNTIAGFSGDGGPATAAQLSQPVDVGLDGAGNIYIADFVNNCIRKIDHATFHISTIAGNGTGSFSGDGLPATDASLQNPAGIEFDSSGNIFIADFGNNRIRKINPSGIISTVAGTGIAGYNGDGEAATLAQLHSPSDLAIDAYGNIYISDIYNDRIRKIDFGATTKTQNIVTPHLSLSVFPNPSLGVFNILANSATDEDLQIAITNLSGEEVFSNKIKSNHPSEVVINQPGGMYYLSVTSKSGRITSEIAIVK